MSKTIVLIYKLPTLYEILDMFPDIKFIMIQILDDASFDPKFKGVYYPRYFNLDAISNDSEGFKNILRTWYTQNPLNPIEERIFG